MPSQAAHEAAAKAHLAAFEAIVDQFPAWGAVTLFYAALHLLEMAFAASGRHNDSHSEREHYIKSTHGSIWPAYHRLQTESLKARYLQGGSFGMNATGVRNELKAIHFNRTEEFTAKLLAAEAAKPKQTERATKAR